jgi:hypothetical protein
MNRPSLGDGLVWVVSAVAAVGAAIGLIRLHDLAFLDSDAAQYLSTARNLLAGQGLSTDLLYYDEHYRFGTLPAPQTVFPPGLPLILASALALGADPAQASVLVGVTCLCLTGLLLAACLVRLRVASPLVLLGVGIWFTLALAWVNVLEGRSEIVFVAMTLASTTALLSPRAGRARLLAAGFFAAAALAIRYQAVFFLGTLGLWWCVLQLLERPDRYRRVMTDGAVLFALPVGIALFIFGRNMALLGVAGGGPVDTVQSGIGGIDLVRAAWWAVSDISGLSLSKLAEGGFIVWLVAGGVLLLALCAGLAPPVSAPSRAPAESKSVRRAALSLAVLYVGVSMAGLVLLATTRAGAYLQGRFLVPLVPFAVIAWIVFLDRWLRATPAHRVFRIGAAGAVLLHAGLLGAQASVADRWLADLRSDRRIAVIRSALDVSVEGATLRQYLLQRATARSPVFAESAQHVWLLLDRPLLGAAGAGFSTKRWTDMEVRRLQRCYGVQLLLFFPPMFDPALPENSNRVIFANLARGEVPAFLRTVLRTAEVELYRLDQQGQGLAPECSAAKEAH